MLRTSIFAKGFVSLLVFGAALPSSGSAQSPDASPVVLEAESPTLQHGSHQRDTKAGASGGEVLGGDFGSTFGDFAEYQFRLATPVAPARLSVRYARQFEGASVLVVILDGARIGTLNCNQTGGWGDVETQFRRASLTLPRLSAGLHRVRFTVVLTNTFNENKFRLRAVSVLDLVGNRSDKNSVGHGKNIALYTGMPSRFFYATHELGDIFSAVDGTTLNWFPDHVAVSPQIVPGNINLDRIEIQSASNAEATNGSANGPANESSSNESSTGNADGLMEMRQVCVTKDDVVVSRLHFQNNGNEPRTRRVEISGDCRGSFDWRGTPGGEKVTRREGNGVLMLDKNVFPGVLPDGLAMVIGGNVAPVDSDVATPGTYRLVYEVKVPAHSERTLLLACSVERSAQIAHANLARVLKQADPLEVNRTDWEHFYQHDVPQFDSSDAKLDELYDFRWFLLKFSTAGGNLGLFKYPVVLEGRQAYQTYCCYSAPFMAFDMNWSNDPQVGFGQIANMTQVAYEDGRFPWYASPRTNNVPLSHASKTGLSLLPYAAWEWYQIHGDQTRLRALYPTMKKNLQWWISDRDPDGNGLFSIDNQLETGMDDLHRRWKTGTPARYEAVDATTYALLNLQAVSKMARELGETSDANFFSLYAQKSSKALQTVTWDATLQRFRDRNPNSGELSNYNSICTFYPLMSNAMQGAQMKEVNRYLLNPNEYWTAHPIPALSQSDPEFDPVKRYWAGPSWPAATSHVIEGFAASAKRLDRSLLPQAAELFRRAAGNHLQPRADFYERYDPFSGKGLSSFRDYMHSWWIDIYIRHVAGLEPQDDGSVVIDPLPMKLKFFALRNAPHRGHKIDVLWNASPNVGLTVRLDGKTVRRQKKFRPGIDRLTLPSSLFR